PGLRLGFVVASSELIKELRALRRLMVRHIPSNNQQVAAGFIAHGFHEAHMRNLIKSYKERANTLKIALSKYAPQLHFNPAQGGSALWVTGPKGLDTTHLSLDLHQRGVVIEPGAVFYPHTGHACASMRVGYSSIPADKIDAGVQLIAKALR
ncbi:MAG: aminotransferase class I/II-fold pyridoxal phosphate-dependent enzyme, partial [Burkholderiales bacterium]